jgi:hypothetical protein
VQHKASAAHKTATPAQQAAIVHSIGTIQTTIHAWAVKL